MCLITSIATALGVSTAAVWGSVATAAATALSTSLGVVGNIQQGKAQQAQMNYQAQVARNNAKVAQANADQKRQEGIEEARTERMKTLQKVGAQQAALAANGVDISQGTALDLIEDTSAMGELDALTKRYNYETPALSYEQQVNNFNNQASLDVFAGQNAYKSGMTNAISTGIGGLGDLGMTVSSKWYSPNSTGNKTRTTGSWKRNTGTLSGDGIKEFMRNYV